MVNLVFAGEVFRQGYDTWCPGQRFTDVVVADWVTRDQTPVEGHNILTCYTPLREQQRSRLLSTEQCRQLASEVLRDFQHLMPRLQVDPVEVNLYRRGHAVHLAVPGLRRVQARARQRFGRILFANTDVQSLISSSYAAVLAAHRAVEELDALA